MVYRVIRGIAGLILMVNTLCADEAPQNGNVADYETERMTNYGALYETYGDDSYHGKPANAQSFLDALAGTQVVANPRIGWIQQDSEVDRDIDTSTATAVGGLFGLQTMSYRDFNFRLVFYTSQKVGFLMPPDPAKANPDYLTNDGNSYAYIGEVELMYAVDNFFISAGNFIFNSPYADTDDLRMTPNTYQGAVSQLRLDMGLEFQLYFLSRWSGWDSANDTQSLDQYKRMGADPDNPSFGVVGGMGQYNFTDDDNVQLWYYYGDYYASIFYLESDITVDFSKAYSMEFGFQASDWRAQKNSDLQGNYVGAMATANYEFASLQAAFNYGWMDGQNYITDGWGGGPYFSSLDEDDISVVVSTIQGALNENFAGTNIGGLQITPSMTWDFIGFDKLETLFSYGYFDPVKYKGQFNEYDIMVNINPIDSLFFNFVYAKVTSKFTYNMIDYDLGFTRIYARLEYAF